LNAIKRRLGALEAKAEASAPVLPVLVFLSTMHETEKVKMIADWKAAHGQNLEPDVIQIEIVSASID